MTKAKQTTRRNTVEKDALPQYQHSDHGRDNDSVASAKPWVLPDKPNRNSVAKGSDGNNKP
ncbi:hypothetical protein DBIPINDM_008312 (plasmid) [Mesorhizobium sp. AR02]|uniref:hypothetical protein n=1 Tax=Mesorhizobium sp. AR02 TaxID=2865837 RepID=UPI00215DDADB|nr:hypothetical protein [Mesorhizobium sp. AR02]UVK57372.1 hypothetical protein DBIPINDM_008312 [Mesorhizobium sp. AR02]